MSNQVNCTEKNTLGAFKAKAKAAGTAVMSKAAEGATKVGAGAETIGSLASDKIAYLHKIAEGSLPGMEHVILGAFEGLKKVGEDNNAFHTAMLASIDKDLERDDLSPEDRKDLRDRRDNLLNNHDDMTRSLIEALKSAVETYGKFAFALAAFLAGAYGMKSGVRIPVIRGAAK